MNNFMTTILASIFIIILLVTYQALRSALNLGAAGTLTMSACVSLLAVIGMIRFLKGSLEILLLPHAALGIAILLLLVTFYFCGHPKRFKERPKMRNKK